jgi:putative bacteriocin precursor
LTKGDTNMFVINPAGRLAGDGVQPRACMCYTTAGFAGARSTDKCSRCGCGCDSKGTYTASNKNVANTTNRKS